MKIYLDSDVVISSLLSKKGASHLLLSRKPQTKISLYISNYSQDEIEKVAKRLNIAVNNVLQAISRLDVVKIDNKLSKIQKQYREYTTDKDDTHIVAGAVISKSEFLVTYNLKHYKIEKIKREFDIKVVTPGILLQYIRNNL